MAASPGGEEDSVYDTARLSLFDLILERTRAQNKVRKKNIAASLLSFLIARKHKSNFSRGISKTNFFLQSFADKQAN